MIFLLPWDIFPTDHVACLQLCNQILGIKGVQSSQDTLWFSLLLSTAPYDVDHIQNFLLLIFLDLICPHIIFMTCQRLHSQGNNELIKENVGYWKLYKHDIFWNIHCCKFLLLPLDMLSFWDILSQNSLWKQQVSNKTQLELKQRLYLKNTANIISIFDTQSYFWSLTILF